MFITLEAITYYILLFQSFRLKNLVLKNSKPRNLNLKN